MVLFKICYYNLLRDVSESSNSEPLLQVVEKGTSSTNWNEMKRSRIGMLLSLLSLTLVSSLGKIGKWTLKQVKKL